jgi:hypothetical protein
MRKLTIILFSIIIGNVASAQYCPPLSGKTGEILKFHVTAGYGVTRLYGEVNQNEKYGSAGTILADYQIRKGLMVGLESQFGSLSAGSKQNNNVLETHNNYIAGGVRLTFFPVGFFSKQKIIRNYSTVLLESMYLAVGSLYVVNNYDYVYRNVLDGRTYGEIAGTDENDNPIFKDRTRTLILPSLNAGLLIPLNNPMSTSSSRISLVLNGQINFGNNDNLDGYVPRTDSGRVVEGKNDVYNFYSLGLRYSF